MTTRLTPYLSFSGTAREAMEFYRGVFGGELTMSTFGEFGDPDAPFADQIMHGQLISQGGMDLMGSDHPAEMGELTSGNSMTVALFGDDVDLLHGYWAKLAEGGTVSTPLEKQMWGDEYGACTDRFGIPWMVNISTPQG